MRGDSISSHSFSFHAVIQCLCGLELEGNCEAMCAVPRARDEGTQRRLAT